MPLTELAIDASRMVAVARTGTENYSVEIIRAMSCLDDAPRLTLYARTNIPLEPLSGVDVKTSGPARLWTHIGLSWALRRDRPGALFVPSHVVPLIHPKATVVTVHDLGYLREPDAHPKRQCIMLDRATRWNVRSARRIIAISGQTKADLVEHYHVDPARVHVVHHGVDHGRFRPRANDESAQVIERYGIATPYLLFVSTVQPRKNVIRLIEAFEALQQDDLALVVVGQSGWLSAPIEARIRQAAGNARVLRLGRVSDDDLPAMYSGAAAYVLPSLFEGFGMGLLEAMASGTPVVTSNTGSLAEVAGDAAVLVDPRSVPSITAGIERVLNVGEGARLRELGLQRAQAFTWQAAASATLDVIREAHDDA